VVVTEEKLSQADRIELALYRLAEKLISITDTDAVLIEAGYQLDSSLRGK
jgi:hypothetical protein